MKVNLVNVERNEQKQVSLGYSWAFSVFGWVLPLIRGDWKWFFITFVATILLGYLTAGMGTIVAQVVFAGFYNKLSTKDLLERGFEPADEFSTLALKKAGLQ